MKSVLLYLVLVGTPLAGLLLILRTGERIEAPPAIGGTWSLDDAFAQAVRRACVPLDLPDENPLLRISQSGRYLQLQFNDAGKTVLPGTLHAGTLAARQALPTGEDARQACGAATLTEFHLRLSEHDEAPRLRGQWGSAACEGCPPLDVVAVQVDAD